MENFTFRISEHIQVVFIPEGGEQYSQKVFIGNPGKKVLVENKLKGTTTENLMK
ncbi:hypothetical protein ACFL2S_02765 [Thermodesulfobacteriota bacterium]